MADDDFDVIRGLEAILGPIWTNPRSLISDRRDLGPCPHCGMSVRYHYVSGHLACTSCGRSVSDCCEGERGE